MKNLIGVLLLGMCSLGSIAVANLNESPLDDHKFVKCESHNYQFNQCPIFYPVAHIEVYFKHSKAPCTYGWSWGYEHGNEVDNHGYVWVDHGCRATFLVEPWLE